MASYSSVSTTATTHTSHPRTRAHARSRAARLLSLCEAAEHAAAEHAEHVDHVDRPASAAGVPLSSRPSSTPLQPPLHAGASAAAEVQAGGPGAQTKHTLRYSTKKKHKSMSALHDRQQNSHTNDDDNNANSSDRSRDPNRAWRGSKRQQQKQRAKTASPLIIPSHLPHATPISPCSIALPTSTASSSPAVAPPALLDLPPIQPLSLLRLPAAGAASQQPPLSAAAYVATLASACASVSASASSAAPAVASPSLSASALTNDDSNGDASQNTSNNPTTTTTTTNSSTSDGGDDGSENNNGNGVRAATPANVNIGIPVATSLHNPHARGAERPGTPPRKLTEAPPKRCDAELYARVDTDDRQHGVAATRADEETDAVELSVVSSGSGSVDRMLPATATTATTPVALDGSQAEEHDVAEGCRKKEEKRKMKKRTKKLLLLDKQRKEQEKKKVSGVKVARRLNFDEYSPLPKGKTHASGRPGTDVVASTAKALELPAVAEKSIKTTSAAGNEGNALPTGDDPAVAPTAVSRRAAIRNMRLLEMVAAQPAMAATVAQGSRERDTEDAGSEMSSTISEDDAAATQVWDLRRALPFDAICELDAGPCDDDGDNDSFSSDADPDAYAISGDAIFAAAAHKNINRSYRRGASLRFRDIVRARSCNKVNQNGHRNGAGRYGRAVGVAAVVPANVGVWVGSVWTLGWMCGQAVCVGLVVVGAWFVLTATRGAHVVSAYLRRQRIVPHT